MSTYAEQPFTEFEERYFLAEILKRSPLPPGTLLSIIRDTGIEPAWTEIALPNGRSVSACQQAYSALFSRTGLPPPPTSADPARRPKRPYSSMGDASSSLPRELQPRPPSFASVNGQQVPIPAPAVMSPVEPQRKKRGRPTKSEFERRQAEARERGEVWPKPRKPKARPSTEGSDVAAGSAVGSAGDSAGGSVGAQTTAILESGTLADASPSVSTKSPGAAIIGGAPMATMYSPTGVGHGVPPRAIGHSQASQQHREQRGGQGPTAESPLHTIHSHDNMGNPLRQHGQAQPPQEPSQIPEQRNLMGGSFDSPQQRQYHAYPMDDVRQGPHQGQR